MQDHYFHFGWYAAGFAILIVLAANADFTNVGGRDAEDLSKADVRFFKNVDPDRTAAQVLVRGGMRPGYGNSVDLVEVNSQLQPITGDTLHVWVQHYSPDKAPSQEARLLRKSQTHDMLVHCFPNSVADGVRTDNAIPTADSLVYVYPLVDSDYVAIAGQEMKALKFAMAHRIKE